MMFVPWFLFNLTKCEVKKKKNKQNRDGQDIEPIMETLMIVKDCKRWFFFVFLISSTLKLNCSTT